jgi:putative membrane protein
MAPDRDDNRTVDARFTLANDRTLLAWTRTALALLAAAGAVHELSDVPARRELAILLGLAGIATAGAGGWRYQRMAAALRRGESPIAGRAPTVLAATVALIGVLLVVAVSLR